MTTTNNLTLDKDREIIITKRIEISNCNFTEDVNDATEWILEQIESDEFQAGHELINLNVTTP